jgi:murein DD-endopeptidase MepM/ murein hydrolase activator NlpD
VREPSDRDYTKGTFSRRAAWHGLLLAACLAAWLAAAPLAASRAAAEPAPDFTGWHLPVPAGDWIISRGPCGAGGLSSHACGYYEDACAIDIAAPNGSMERVPVLAPQAGQVFFLGTRNDSGLTVLLQHDDGRVTALMHLSRVVVGLDQRVARGQVLAYAGGTGSSTRPHLHFHVQPNAVQRECLPLANLDTIDLVRFTATSRNLAWPDLTLVDPPDTLPAWLALLPGNAPGAGPGMPGRLVLRPGGRVGLPIAVANSTAARGQVVFSGRALTPTAQTATHTLFTLPVLAPAAAGDYTQTVQIKGSSSAAREVPLALSVREPAETSAAEAVVWISPTFVSPSNWASVLRPPRLCWTEPASAGAAPLSFRVMVVGTAAADSGWISASCWQAPALGHGTYYWKVFVRDADGHMNRTNQRPYVFQVR